VQQDLLPGMSLDTQAAGQWHPVQQNQLTYMSVDTQAAVQWHAQAALEALTAVDIECCSTAGWSPVHFPAVTADATASLMEHITPRRIISIITSACLLQSVPAVPVTLVNRRENACLPVAVMQC
jgi:hypothetical protein